MDESQRRWASHERLLAGVVGLLIASGSAAGCAGPGEDAWVSPAGGPGDVGAPGTARVVCDGTATRVETPIVRPQPDGVHMLVANTSGRDLTFQWDLGGDNAPRGEHESVLQVAPGTIRVRCQDPSEDAGAPGGYVDVEVSDTEGLYVPYQIACEEISAWFADFGPDATGDPDPVQSVRDTLSWLRPDDVVERAGYPGAAPVVRVVREGEVIASVSFMADGRGGWLQEHGETCVGLDMG